MVFGNQGIVDQDVCAQQECLLQLPFFSSSLDKIIYIDWYILFVLYCIILSYI